MKKQEIRHDPIRENIVKVVGYFKKNKQQGIKLFLVILLIIGGISYFNRSDKVKIVNAGNISGRAQNSFINSQTEVALSQFRTVLNDYPNTPAAAQALVYMLNDAVNKQDDVEINRLLSQYNIDSNDPVVSSTFYKLKGDIAMNDGNIQDAVSYYNKAQSISDVKGLQVKYQLDLVSALIIQQEFDQALTNLEGILEEEDVNFTVKNTAEELRAFVTHKLGI